MASHRHAGWILAGVACAVLGAGGPARADEDFKKDMAQHRLEKMTKVLELTADQQTQVQQVMQDYQDKRAALKQQLDALRQEEDGKIKALLTADQQPKYDKWLEKKEERRKERLEHWKEKKAGHRSESDEGREPEASEGQ